MPYSTGERSRRKREEYAGKSFIVVWYLDNAIMAEFGIARVFFKTWRVDWVRTSLGSVKKRDEWGLTGVCRKLSWKFVE